MYSRDTVREVAAANDIVQVLGATIELKNAGPDRLKGLCPFHREKTPSFVVSRARQSYHCFGCGKGGDVFSFVMEHEGLTFVEALRRLADRAGIRLPAMTEGDSRAEALRSQLLGFGKFARGFFQEELQHPARGRAGREYLEGRKLREDTVARFGLGFVPEGWRHLLDAAKRKGFSEKVLEASGMFKQGDRGGYYDFFRNRLMFPVRDVSGNVVAFGGRDLGDSPAKYINSPETSIYKKSRVLYGLHEARDALREKKQALLVEGYFDLLRCFDAGIENVVASCGTALTPEQASLIGRYVREVVIVYDGDAAGVAAAIKAAGTLTAAGLTVRAMALPDNQDPDDYIRDHGAEAFLSLVTAASDFVTFHVRMSADRTRTIEGRTEVAQELFATLREVDDSPRLDEYLKRAAEELGLHNKWNIRREYEKFLRRGAAWKAVSPAPQAQEAAPLNQDDCDFVWALLNNAELLARAREKLAEIPLPPGALSEVLHLLFTESGVVLSRQLPSEEARRLYSAAAASEGPAAGSPEELVEKRVNRLGKDWLRKQSADLQEAIRQAERSNDQAKLVELSLQKMKILRQIEQVGAM